ncbi:hypothetical protein GCM10010988_05790 [Cnuibacter physcomitrellae]|uniref:Uncharacterized protein n=1 Tax=Cnuibacter physcomitrellae TaxID=1619308 RepID=A0A1X9LU40_9MICO|nr:hypothetical protein [Cnuibacter physcomitrellae]ARJ05490.1 hypothetical protein B5808_09830 [Cnuibacter physcomitrellae]GGI35805.1 hypothetical protein GCM10010988_05790 [Cnuibacter physcomitrellae]
MTATIYTPGLLATDAYLDDGTLLPAGSEPTQEQAAQLTNPKLWRIPPSTGVPVTPERERTVADLALHSRGAATVQEIIDADEDDILRNALRDYLGVK